MTNTPPTSLRDADLVELFLAGDGDAVREVDGWIAQAAWSYRQRLSNEWDDILQEIRLELTRLLSRGSFRGDSSLKTYLWRVVNHTCIDRLRAGPAGAGKASKTSIIGGFWRKEPVKEPAMNSGISCCGWSLRPPKTAGISGSWSWKAIVIGK